MMFYFRYEDFSLLGGKMDSLKSARKIKNQLRASEDKLMQSEGGMLRSLHDIQRSIPDKDFFTTRQRLIKKGEPQKKKAKDGLFGSSFLASKKKAKIDIELAREQVKSFHNSFQVRNRSVNNEKTSEPGMMSIAAMKEFRMSIREAVASEDANFHHHALEAIVKYIDLKNSGIVKDKQEVLLDCLAKVGQALHEDGGLSMFHTTWFLSIYREYLIRFKIFQRGEYDKAIRYGSKEAKIIAKKLNRKQFEIPHYFQLIDEKKFEVKQIMHYSKDGNVKRSKHGQRGCSRQDIREIFLEKCRGDGARTPNTSTLNEVNIIMSYALLFAKIPMLNQVVDSIKSIIPNLNLETGLYKQKITLAQKINLLDIARGVYRNDGSDEYSQKLYLLALSVYQYCTGVIVEKGLNKIPLKNEIYVHPLLKQAALLINYKDIFKRNKEGYLKLFEKSAGYLNSVKACSINPEKSMKKLAEHAEIYERSIESIKEQLRVGE